MSETLSCSLDAESWQTHVQIRVRSQDWLDVRPKASAATNPVQQNDLVYELKR